MKIDITQELIESATRKYARAIQQQYDVQHVIVDVQSIRFSRPGKDKRYTYLTPRIAQKQILAFDRGEPIEPWSFNLYVPAKVQAIRHKPASSEATRKKSREAYEQRTNNRERKSRKGYTRERQYGVRIVESEALGLPPAADAVARPAEVSNV